MKKIIVSLVVAIVATMFSTKASASTITSKFIAPTNICAPASEASDVIIIIIDGDEIIIIIGE